MKLYYAIFVPLFCLILISTALADQPPQPKAVIENPDYVFESVLDGTELIHNFVIENSGSETLEITKVITT